MLELSQQSTAILETSKEDQVNTQTSSLEENSISGSLRDYYMNSTAIEYYLESKNNLITTNLEQSTESPIMEALGGDTNKKETLADAVSISGQEAYQKTLELASGEGIDYAIASRLAMRAKQEAELAAVADGRNIQATDDQRKESINNDSEINDDKTKIAKKSLSYIEDVINSYSQTA